MTTATKAAADAGIVVELRAARTAWLEQHCVPISMEFVRFANAIGGADDTIVQLLEALEGVVRVADRQTKEFDAARTAIQKARGGQ